MAKKQLTPEEYKAKLEKKADKRKKFGGAFLKAFALFLGCAIVFSASNIAFTRTSLAKGATPANGGAEEPSNSSDDDVNFFDEDPASDGSDTQNTDTQNPDAQVPGDSTDGAGNQSGSGDNKTSGSQSGSTTASILTNRNQQFDYFVKAFNDVKKSAKSVTIVKKNGSNYKGIAEAGMFSSVLQGLMSSLLKEETVNETYTGADIVSNFPPANATSNLDKNRVQNLTFKEDGNYYEITVAVKGETNPTLGKGVGAIASPLTKESITEPIKDIPGLNRIEPICAYETVSCTAKVEKSTGHMVEYYYNMPLVLSFEGMSYRVGLAFEEWWTIAW